MQDYKDIEISGKYEKTFRISRAIETLKPTQKYSQTYWLPVDARTNDDTNWIIVDTVTTNARKIKAKHIRIVADSCYSGTFSRKIKSELLPNVRQHNNFT